MRFLKHHEKKLLRKVNFFDWSSEANREVEVMRRYHVQRREDYTKYNKICGYVTKLVNLLKSLGADDSFRISMTEHLLSKLYEMGLIPAKKSLVSCEKLSVSAFCRRRLPVIIVKLRLAQNLKDAVRFIEQGHIKVGPQVITDPAFHVSRTYEDFVTWTTNSAIKKKVLRYNQKLDDFDFINF